MVYNELLVQTTLYHVRISFDTETSRDTMTGIEIIILGIALSMDAFAVTISNMFTYRSTSIKRALLMPLFFGAFQGIMPLIGYFAGHAVSSLIEQYAGIITFVILGFIGGKMIWDAFHEEPHDAEECVKKGSVLTVGVLFFQAIATSIDALAVGVSFAALSVNVVFAALAICLTTALCTALALLIGRRFGAMLGSKATIIGGSVLILIGVKELFL